MLSRLNKFIGIKYDPVNYPSDTRSKISRTFADAVLDIAGTSFDETQIFVSYNGQRILQRHTETASTFSRFYYEITSATTEHFTIDIYANASYVIPGYSNPTPLTFQIEDTDIFFVDYTYCITV